MIIDISNIDLNNKTLIFETSHIFCEKLYFPLCFKFKDKYIPVFSYDNNWNLPDKWILSTLDKTEKILMEKAGMILKNRELNLVEKGNFLENFDTIDDELLELIKLKKNKNGLEIIKKLSSFSKMVKNSVIKHNFNLQLLSLLFDFNEEEINRIFKIFDIIPLSTGGKRGILENLYDIKKIKNYSIKEILEEIDFHIISEIENKPEASKKFVNEIFKMKFPTLSKIEKKYLELRGHLKFERGVFIVKPEFFEDENYEIKIKFKNIEELKKRVKNVEEISENPYMKEIMELI